MSLLVQAASYVGDYAPAATVRFKFSVTSATGVMTTLTGTPAVKIYKDGDTTESTAGVTLTVDFDSRTGLCDVAIDTSADGTFYAAGSDFEAVITAGTVGVVDVSGSTVGHFSLQNRSTGALAVSAAGGVTLADGVSHGGTPGSSTATIAFSRMVGTAQTADTPAFAMTGTGTAPGGVFQGGPSDADGLQCVGGGTYGNGLVGAAGGNTGRDHGLTAGILGVGAAADNSFGMYADGGGGNSDGFDMAGTGNSGKGLYVSAPVSHAAQFGAGSDGSALKLIGGFTTGDGITISTTAGHGISVAAAGAGKHDINLAGDGTIQGDLAGHVLGALSDLAAVPSATATTTDALSWLLMLARNRRTQTATTETVYKNDSTTTAATSAKSEDGTTFTRSKYA